MTDSRAIKFVRDGDRHRLIIDTTTPPDGLDIDIRIWASGRLWRAEINADVPNVASPEDVPRLGKLPVEIRMANGSLVGDGWLSKGWIFTREPDVPGWAKPPRVRVVADGPMLVVAS